MHFEIRSPSRIHMSLIDLNGNLGRIDGGYGMALDDPAFLIEFSDICEAGLQYEGPNDYFSLVNHIYIKIQNVFQITIPRINVKVIDVIPEHIGLGSKTQFLLTIAKGLAIIAKISPSIEELTKLVGRGGTSGIGFRIFEQGGFILDGGHSYGEGKEKEQFLPSSASPASPSPLLIRYSIPEDWRIILILLNVKQGANNTEEVNIFQKYCPIPQADVLKISHRILMQILPGMVTNNLHLIGEAQTFINGHGFKNIEISLQDPNIKKIILRLQDKYKNPIGMSSFGPSIYMIASNKDEAIHLKQTIEEILKDNFYPVSGTIKITKPNNIGHRIQNLD